MNTRQIGVVFRKEFTDTLRDRRTLINSIVIPLILTPVLMLGFIGAAVYFARSAIRTNPDVMLLGAEHAPRLAESLRMSEDLKVVPPADDYVKRINDKKLRAAVEFPPGFEENLKAHPDQPQVVKIYWFEGEFRSRSVTREVDRAIRDFSTQIVTERLSTRGLSDQWLKPFTAKRTNVAPPERVSGNVLGFIAPYFLIILCLTGAIYPAMDLTAGEKERGTIETILASPVQRVELVIGKFLLVLLTSLVTTAMAVVMLALSALAAGRMFGQFTPNLVLSVSSKAAAAVFILILPLAVLFSAGLMAISVMARNYREAQTYLGPLMFVVILPAMASFIPGVELNARLALIPILNMSLVSKEIFAGNYPWGMIGLIFASTLVYAAGALYLAVRQFRREDVLFRT